MISVIIELVQPIQNRAGRHMMSIASQNKSKPSYKVLNKNTLNNTSMRDSKIRKPLNPKPDLNFGLKPNMPRKKIK